MENSRAFFAWEYTDTFAGEANYCWVRRGRIEYTASRTSDREIARRVKAAAGLTGVRGRSYWHGDSYEFRPYNSCTVLFAQYDDSPTD